MTINFIKFFIGHQIQQQMKNNYLHQRSILLMLGALLLLSTMPFLRVQGKSEQSSPWPGFANIDECVLPYKDGSGTIQRELSVGTLVELSQMVDYTGEIQQSLFDPKVQVKWYVAASPQGDAPLDLDITYGHQHSLLLTEAMEGKYLGIQILFPGHQNTQVQYSTSPIKGYLSTSHTRFLSMEKELALLVVVYIYHYYPNIQSEQERDNDLISSLQDPLQIINPTPAREGESVQIRLNQDDVRSALIIGLRATDPAGTSAMSMTKA